jgi:cell fate regulator YaaT (PSP1 superfamily)
MAATERFGSESDAFRADDEVIVRTARGIDAGVAMGRPRPRKEGEEVQGELLRAANDADQNILTHIRDLKEPEEFSTCQECIRERDLPMRLVGVEHLFSGDKIIFYFLAENRVDFRELVKELARRYRTRIEMRQIGVRDEARLLADFEHCGRELCCRTFIRNLEPVTMRMAKMQKTTLDPSKISGHCGRLMCCLRFEDEVYSTLQAEMPARGSVCVTEKFTGEVAAYDMFKQEITLTLPDGSQEAVQLSEITEIKPRRKSGGPPQQFPAGQGQGGGPRPSGRFGSGEGGRRGGNFDNAKPRGERPNRREDRRSNNNPNGGGGENASGGEGGAERNGNG